MKRRFFVVLTAIVLLLSMVMLNRANPIIEGFFNELVFEAAGWKLEMHVLSTTTLDGWYLTSRSGQAYFKNGIQLGGAYRVITPESLLTPLTINRLGDSLTIHSPQFAYALMLFGPGGFVAAPCIGQSMCLRESGTQFYYLDNTPTLGQPNHALDAMGIVQGRVADSLGLPISGVQISWGDPPFVYSDTGGNFALTEYARRLSLRFSHANFATRSISVQVWPESTVVLGVVLDRIVGVNGTGASEGAAFELQVNYPNPFNPSTTISYRLPDRKYVTLKVFDLSGREVAALVNGLQDGGYRSVRFDAANLASGIYFYRLTVGELVAVRKMIVLQ